MKVSGILFFEILQDLRIGICYETETSQFILNLNAQLLCLRCKRNVM